MASTFQLALGTRSNTLGGSSEQTQGGIATAIQTPTLTEALTDCGVHLYELELPPGLGRWAHFFGGTLLVGGHQARPEGVDDDTLCLHISSRVEPAKVAYNPGLNFSNLVVIDRQIFAVETEDNATAIRKLHTFVDRELEGRY